MSKTNFVSFRVTDEEMERIESLAGQMTPAAFCAEAAFSKIRVRGDDTQYPGWEILERGRRDKGIKIGRSPAPLGMKSPVILYPEDKEYRRFSEM